MRPKLYLINGPLGAGKTTFLQHLLAQPQFDSARVVENEFASTSIDTATLHDHTAEVQTIAGVCICCSTGDELVEALEGLAASSQPVIIEATGVANSLQLVEKLVLGDMLERYDLAHAIFVLDGAETSAEAPAQYADELHAADTVLVSKLDLLAPSARRALMSQLPEGAQAVNHGETDLAFLARPSRIVDYYAEHDGELRAHDTRANYANLRLGYAIEPSVLKAAWPRLAHEFGLHRLKGDIVDEAGAAWHVQATPAQIRVTNGDPQATPQLVCIGQRARDITPDTLQELL